MTTVTTSEIRVDDLTAHVARPPTDTETGMLLLPMVTGIGAQVRAYAADVAERGHVAVVWDPWHGPSSDDTPVDELRVMMSGLTDTGCLDEQRRLLDHMHDTHDGLGLCRVGVMGWCLGGRFALLLAARDARVATCVAYHPTVLPETRPNQTEDAVAAAGQIAAPVKLVYPGDDHIVPRTVFDDLQRALQGRPEAATSVGYYPGAEHGFMEERRRERPANRAATTQSWAETLAFATATLG
ncbi:dienelactone hydrolase family protein [Spiractinospora alimapuensis]|uniref:dienelactone hydrolase family protein n=1 Tax=Spiractinospora alimapuensis TaxID=2820884 RepID=UPI001F45E3CA|nr:dienelactone hydrolase family protein [Spiractinospora alimapuensis]QVQ52875.1 dienelactone hydrolase family protein [Spiractinospora alimapuensis]